MSYKKAISPVNRNTVSIWSQYAAPNAVLVHPSIPLVPLFAACTRSLTSAPLGPHILSASSWICEGLPLKVVTSDTNRGSPTFHSTFTPVLIDLFAVLTCFVHCAQPLSYSAVCAIMRFRLHNRRQFVYHNGIDMRIGAERRWD